MSSFCVAGFGEVMLRLCPAGKKRFAQVLPGQLEATYGGGEANVLPPKKPPSSSR